MLDCFCWQFLPLGQHSGLFAWRNHTEPFSAINMQKVSHFNMNWNKNILFYNKLQWSLSSGGENNTNLSEENIRLTFLSVHSLEHYIKTRCVCSWPSHSVMFLAMARALTIPSTPQEAAICFVISIYPTVAHKHVCLILAFIISEIKKKKHQWTLIYFKLDMKTNKMKTVFLWHGHCKLMQFPTVSYFCLTQYFLKWLCPYQLYKLVSLLNFWPYHWYLFLSILESMCQMSVST